MQSSVTQTFYMNPWDLKSGRPKTVYWLKTTLRTHPDIIMAVANAIAPTIRLKDITDYEIKETP